jgi:hypothetical protein
MQSRMVTLMVVALSASAVKADQKLAMACAVGLSAPARQIYDAVNAGKVPVTDLVRIVREQTMALVQAGQIPMATAPDSASAAARCLELQH